MRKCILNAAFTAWIAAAQTQIDLRTQTKSIDFTAASFTKPVKTGTTLPAGCTLGELFLNVAAPAGANLFACTSLNGWSVQGGSDPLAVMNSGVAVGTRERVNFIPGQGLTSIMTDTGSQINIQLGLDSAVIQTQPGEQSGLDLLCASVA